MVRIGFGHCNSPTLSTETIRMKRHGSFLAIAAVLSASAFAPAIAQQAPSGQAQGSQPQTPPFDFSGVVFGNYSFRTDSLAKSQTGGKSPNGFNIERVYLTFQKAVGARASIRATTDIFQNANGNYYSGWTVRLKYGYLQYNFANNIGGSKGFNWFGRVGMLHTVIIDHNEGFWPRYLGQTAIERAGFFSSADLGVASQLSLPNGLGALYGTITNGPGYASPETDRFKDFALRLTLTPFGSQGGFLKTFDVTPWVYKGYTGSKFANGGTGQVGPVTEGLDRNRWGVFAGIKDPRLTAGLEYARRTEGVESGANTSTSPRTVANNTGDLISAFGVARPFTWSAGGDKQAWGLVARWDRFKPNTSVDANNRFITLGTFLELTSRASIALDYQEQTPESYTGAVPASALQTRTWFVHWVANF